jgi:hypothetical protein
MQRHAALETPAGTVPQLTGTRLARPRAAVTAPVAVLSAGVAWTALIGIDHRFISFSDGVYMYAASAAAAHGLHALYSSVALSLPPGALVGSALLWKLSPHVETVRLALAMLGLLTAVLAYGVGRRIFFLGPWPAALAAVLSLTGPIHAQFVGLDGEAVLAPLALALALAIERRRALAATALLGLGFVFKLTWAPFFLAGLVALALRDGRRNAVKAGAGGILVALGLYAAALGAFGWSIHDVLAQLVLAEMHSDLQLGLIPGLAATVVVVWWPFLLLARTGLRTGGTTALTLTAAGAFSALYMLKQGTFFNVLAPLEPFLAIAGVAGGVAAWNRRRGRALVCVCALAAVLHAASVSTATLTRALPFPLGAALVSVDNERSVDRIAGAIRAHSTPSQPVLVNPLFAVVAQRREPADAADWFILRALERYCGTDTGKDRHCTDWTDVKALARRGGVHVVSVDSNVVSFDSAFRADTDVASMHRVIAVQAPPIKSTIYAR